MKITGCPGDIARRAGAEGWRLPMSTWKGAWRGQSTERRGGPAGAVVRPLVVVRCDLDLPMMTAGPFPGPFAVGQETVAEVVAIGNHVRDRKPGDRV